MNAEDKTKILLKPEWLKKKLFNSNKENTVKKIIKSGKLHTVCAESKCPNIGECFSNRTATFLLLGNVCTRNCRFCNISSNKIELSLDPDEPKRVSDAVKEMNLKYVVLTSVTRDDLSDGGSLAFTETVERIKKNNPQIKVEVLVPDFQGNTDCVQKVLNSGIDVFGHNLETVKRLYKTVRPEADYQRSLSILSYAGRNNKNITLKTGIMLGLGEKEKEILELIKDFHEIKGQILTIGQYLAPSLKSFPVKEYILPEKFEFYREFGENIGIGRVVSAPFVRSSYLAEKFFL